MKSRTSTNPLGAPIRLIPANPASVYRSNPFKAAMILIAVMLISLAAIWLTQAASQTMSRAAPPQAIQVYDATAAMREAVVYSWEVDAAAPYAPYDSTAAMRNAVVESWEVRAPVTTNFYDATAAMRESVMYSWEVDETAP